MTADRTDPATETAVDELFAHPEPVPLVYWREFTGAKTAVLLSTALAVLTFVTGLSHLSQTSLTLGGPLAGLVPAGSGQMIGLVGVFLSFVLAVVTVGLQRRLKVAWYGAVALFSAVIALGLVTGASTDVFPLVVGFVALPMVVANRSQFDQAVDLTPFQTAALLSFVGVQVYGTVGTYVMRSDFVGVSDLTDAFYYIVVTGTTVGYGDATPTTELTKLFSLSVIVLGTGSFTVASGSLLLPAIESRISSAFGNMTASELKLLEDHVLVLGYGDLTEPLLDELVETTDVVVITEDTDTASALRDRDVTVLTADPTDTQSLLDASVDTASGVVAATEDDAQDTLAIIAVRQVNPDVRVVAAATEQQHVDKLEGVGADEVISPAVIGGQLLGRSVLDEDRPLFDGTDGET